MSVLGRKISEMLKHLERDDYPRDGICSHHGVSISHPFLRLSISDHMQKLMVTVYSERKYSEKRGRTYDKCEGLPGYWVGYPAALHQMRARSISEALNVPIRERWNGGDGQSGVSLVLDRPCPESLMTAISNYRGMPSPFDLRDEDKHGFGVFKQWMAPIWAGKGFNASAI